MAIVLGGNYTAFQKKLIGLAYENIHRCDKGKSRHISFIVNKKRQILVMGWNFENKSHPLAKKYGYYNANIHSELHCISRFPRHHFDISDCSLWNIRIDRHNYLRMSAPCQKCQNLLIAFNIKKTYYTDNCGNFILY